MATQVQFRRGNTAQTSTFTGATAEITIDTTKNTVVVHDGSTVGGIPLAKESALTSNVASLISAFNTANAAFSTANFAFLAANTATATDTTQNNSITAAFTAANSAGVYANSAFASANAATATDTTQNNSITAAFATANSSGVYANSAFTHVNAAFAFANTISGGAAIDNVARSTATAAGLYANSAFAAANTKLSSSGGSITGDISITGNLTVTGNTTYTNTTTLLVADNIITVNAAINQNAQPAVNAGIEVDRGAQPNTSILWIETLGKWTANNGNGTITLAADSAESYANSGFVVANLAFSTANFAFLAANTADAKAVTAGSYANSGFTQANSNYISAVTRLTVTNSGASAYLIDQYTGNNPSIYVSGGETIAFHLNGISGHPFMIRVSSGGANYDTGLTHVANNGTVTTQSSAQGQVAGTLYWKVPFDIVGSTYVYQCSAHAGMVGNVVIQQPASFVASNTTLAFVTANAAFSAANSAAGDGLAFAIALG